MKTTQQAWNLRFILFFNVIFSAAAIEAAEKLAKCEITEPTLGSQSSSLSTSSAPTSAANADPVKRLKNLRKKLKDIELLEEKIKVGSLKTPDKDQKEKISKKNDTISEIKALEIENS